MKSIGADKIGCVMPKRAVSGVEIGMYVSRNLDMQLKANYHSLKMNTGERRHL
jgi:hypothetical protein